MGVSYGYVIGFFGLNSDVLSDIQEYFKAYPESVIVKVYSELDCIGSFGLGDLSLAIDSTQSDFTHQILANCSSFYSVPLVILGLGVNTDWIFYTEYSLDCQTSAIISVLRYFKLLNLGVVWNYSSKSQNVVAKLQKFSKTGLFINVGSNSVQEISKLFIKTFKTDAVQNFLFLGDSSYCSLYEKSFSSSYLEKKGNFAIYLDECIYQVFDKGALILTTQKTSTASSYSDYILKLFLPYLSVFQHKGLSNYQIKKFYNQNINDCEYFLVNVQSSGNIIVGSIVDGNVNITNKVLFYGGEFNRTIYSQPLVTISANTGILNPPGYPNLYQNANYMQGTYFGVNKINEEKKIIPNYFLNLYDGVNCGISVFVANFSRACFLYNIKFMGVAYIPPTAYSITRNVASQLQQLNINIPLIGGLGTNTPLSSKSNYPNFIRIVSPSHIFAEAWSSLVRIYGWKKIVVFYTNDAFGTNLYSTMVGLESTYKYEIVNSPDYRLVPSVVSTADLANFTSYALDALNTGCNLFFLAMVDPTPFFLLEALYDLGVRRGNLTYFFFAITGLDAINITGGDPVKRAELMHGSFLIFNAGYIGSYGKSIETEILKAYNNSSWMKSFYNDVVFTAANTINFLLEQGKPYENNSEFMNAARNIRFRGATGIISFDHNSNDRNLYYLNLYNFHQDSLTGLWYADTIGLISPLGNVYFILYREPVWPSGSFPADSKSNYLNCPFRKDQIQNSTIGRNIKIEVSLGLLGLTCLLTVYISKKMDFIQVPMLESKVYANFEDYLALAFIFIEGLQISAIGPEFSSFNQILQEISDTFSLEVSFKDSTFWIAFYSMLGLSYGWIFLLLTSLFFTFFRIKFLRSYIELIKKISIPVVSNYFFIPITTVLMSIFICDKSYGPSPTQNYLNYDCNQACWDSNHISKVIPASFIIVFYVPLAIFYRTIWQEDSPIINVRTNSVYLVGKNMIYVFLIFIEKILKTDYSLAHAIVFEFTTIGLLIFMLLKVPFNFDRANLWGRVIGICLIWNGLVCLFTIIISSNIYSWRLIEVSGLVGIIAIGIILQRKLPPSFLVTKKGKNIGDLFKFAFGLKSLPSINNTHYQENSFQSK